MLCTVYTVSETGFRKRLFPKLLIFQANRFPKRDVNAMKIPNREFLVEHYWFVVKRLVQWLMHALRLLFT